VASLAGSPVSLGYFANDDVQSVTVPGGVSRAYSYKPNGPIDTIAVTGSAGQIAQFSYSYDDALNLASATDSDGTHTFSYDGLNRLTQATHPAASGLQNESYS
jgi:YD repeat-containing protein